MKFIHLTDTHLVPDGQPLHGLDPAERLRGCVAHIAEHHSDAQFCILTGDVADAGEPGAYHAIAQCLAAMPMPVFLIPGNHDDRAAFQAQFDDAFCDGNGFIQGVLVRPEGHFILLDTLDPAQGHAGGFCELRAQWLTEQLAQAGDSPVYLFMHHPPFDIGIPALDIIGLRDAGRFERAIEQARNVRHIFFGHAHRPISGHWRGISFSTLFGTNHQTLLDFNEPQYLAYTGEPAGYGVVLLDKEKMVIHTSHFLLNVEDIKGRKGNKGQG